jgi:hypothetical protein
MKKDFFPGPGERRTTIVVWDVDDPAKQGDARYWWDESPGCVSYRPTCPI